MKDLFWMSLSFVKGIGSKRLTELYEQYPYLTFDNLADKVPTMTRKSLHKQLTTENITAARKRVEKLLAEHEKADIKMIPISSDYYPEQLRLIPDPPTVLYAKGNMELLKESNQLAVVGTRNPTDVGIKAAEKIARIFAEKNYVIVSGLALGIDTAAHRGALQAETGKTIAILAGNLTEVYPAKNRKLAEEILAKDGLWLSETPIGQASSRGNFVKRDRIQSGLSLAVCPVQTPLKSGTQHTIEFSRQQKRLLFTPIPLKVDEGEDAIQGNLELIESGVLVLENKESYAVIEAEMEAVKKELKAEHKRRFTNKNEKPTNEEQMEQLNLFDL